MPLVFVCLFVLLAYGNPSVTIYVLISEQVYEYGHAPHNDVSVNDGPHYDGGPIIL